MNKADVIFKQNIERILYEGTWDENPRPRYASDGKPAYSKFITSVYEEYDLSEGETPFTNLRPIAWKNAVKEILWFYIDQTSDLNVLVNKYGIGWWDAWDIGDGTIGQRYGATVKEYDIINNLIMGILQDPFGRGHIINLFQYADLRKTKGLRPCAFQSMYSVRRFDGDLYLDASLSQRSSDYLVAGHINMIQYVALQMMIAHACNMKVGKFSRYTQNLHIYGRHIEQAFELLKRKTFSTDPVFSLNAEGKGFYDITIDDFSLEGYEPVKPQMKFDLGI